MDTEKFKVIIVEDVKLELKGTEEIFRHEIPNAEVIGTAMTEAEFWALFTVDPIAAAGDRQIAEYTMTDRVVTGTSDADPLTVAVKSTVRHGDVFADRGFLLVVTERTDHDAVVTGPDRTVADMDPAASVQVDPVVIDHLLASGDGDSIDLHIVAFGEQHAPTRRVDHGNIFDKHILTVV